MTIKTDAMKHIEHKCDLCIIGGGLSGIAAAISAAREGVKVVLIQDRPMFGGNSSSEIRMWVRGAKGEHNRETGLISEWEQENIYRNPELISTGWDNVLFSSVKAEKNIDVLLNTTCLDADTNECSEITRVYAWQLTTYTWHTVTAKYYADCTGDSVLAPIVGALWRSGREAKSEFNENICHDKADRKTMGMSCLIQARETDHKIDFIPPSWAYAFPDDRALGGIPTMKNVFNGSESVSDIKITDFTAMSRSHKIETSGTNLWWIELGGDCDSIHDAESVRDELIKLAYGIWDHIKNHGDHGADNWELEWIGCLPGKRESRRYIGEYILTENDIESEGKFDDIIAYGGWPMDDHNPAGFNSGKLSAPSSILYPAPSPYGIPYRVLYSKNIKNLFFAGRNISATHAANSSTRVMATCSLLGQAMGTAAAMCINDNLTPHEIYEKEIGILQDKLLDAGCYLPWHKRKIPTISKKAKLNLSDADRDLLFNGHERPDAIGTINYVSLNVGDSIEITFDKPEKLTELRLVFDQDFSRKSISKNKKMRIFAMKLHTGSDFKPVTVANTLVKSFEVYADGNKIYSEENNYFSLRRIPLDVTAEKLSVKFTETAGLDKVHIFSCDIK